MVVCRTLAALACLSTVDLSEWRCATRSWGGAKTWPRTGGCAMAVINVIGICGTAFGLLVTIALFFGYMDERRQDGHRLHDAEDSRAH